ncbi:hypothetical protein J7K55_09260 [Candidatus Aerophobetes bacterium]|nr:hypothetical protein [Candidatus Aerophobetes bacterium]
MKEEKLSSSKIIKKEEISLTDKPILIKSAYNNHSMKINLKKEGEIIRVIEVICSCGNKINIICEYENENFST